MKIAIPVKPNTTTEIAHDACGEIVRAHRTARGLSLGWLAKKMGITAAYLSDLEKARRNWTEKKFNKAIAAIHNKAPAWKD